MNSEFRKLLPARLAGTAEHQKVTCERAELPQMGMAARLTACQALEAGMRHSERF